MQISLKMKIVAFLCWNIFIFSEPFDPTTRAAVLSAFPTDHHWGKKLLHLRGIRRAWDFFSLENRWATLQQKKDNQRHLWIVNLCIPTRTPHIGRKMHLTIAVFVKVGKKLLVLVCTPRAINTADSTADIVWEAPVVKWVRSIAVQLPLWWVSIRHRLLWTC